MESLGGIKETFEDHEGMPKGPATGKPTDTVDVPFDEIESPGGQVIKSPAKKAAKKSARKVAKKKVNPNNKHDYDPEVDRQAYLLRVEGMEWDQISSKIGRKSPWSFARRHALRNKLPYPPQVAPEKPAEEPEEAKVEEPMPEPIPAPPEPPRRTEDYKIKLLKDHPEIEKVTSGQIGVLDFYIGQRRVRLSLNEIPNETQANRMVERELRRAGVLR